ncbi:MAG: hypothetical protein U0Q47_01360 [Mycobacterium sp.]
MLHRFSAGVCSRLARTWRVLISAIVPEEAVPYFPGVRGPHRGPVDPVVVDVTGPSASAST